MLFPKASLPLVPYLLLAIGLTLAASAANPVRAQDNTLLPSDPNQPLRIIMPMKPEFPSQATDLSLTSGQVRAYVSVDTSGNLRDSLIVGYTHPVFADAASDMIKSWRYRPALVNGDPVPTTQELLFNFDQKGLVVVTQKFADQHDAIGFERKMHEYVYRAYGLSELDHDLVPKQTVNPAYPPELAAQGVTGAVTVTYFVDETGRARMPMAPASAPRQLADLAVAAVRQWTFEPPLRDGKPVLAQVSQTVNFGVKK